MITIKFRINPSSIAYYREFLIYGNIKNTSELTVMKRSSFTPGREELMKRLEMILDVPKYTINRLDIAIFHGVSASLNNVEETFELDRWLNQRSLGWKSYLEGNRHLRLLFIMDDSNGDVSNRMIGPDGFMAQLSLGNNPDLSSTGISLANAFMNTLTPERALKLEAIKKDFEMYMKAKHGRVYSTYEDLREYMDKKGFISNNSNNKTLGYFDMYTLATQFGLLTDEGPNVENIIKSVGKREISQYTFRSIAASCEIEAGTILSDAVALTVESVVAEFVEIIAVLICL